MKTNRIKYLISISIVSFIALCLIQGYLLYNTYQLKKQVFVDDLKSSIDALNDVPEIQQLNEAWYLSIIQNLATYKNTVNTKKEVVQAIKTKTDSINAQFITLLQEVFEESEITHRISYKKEIQDIILYDNELPVDTVYSGAKTNTNLYLGSNQSNKEKVLLSTGKWFSKYDKNDAKALGIDGSLDVEIITGDYVSLTNWEKEVLLQMIGIFAISIVLLVFVVGLFYISFSTLLRQKKIATMRNDFINNITHELKTPLATLKVASKSLHNKEVLHHQEALENTIAIIDRQSNRLHRIVDQVLQKTIGAEELELNYEEVSLVPFITTIIEDFSLLNEANSVTIEWVAEEREMKVSFDAFLMTTVLLNILENAVKYGKDVVRISVNVIEDKQNYHISITDNGLGISPKEQERIFDKFYRVQTGNIHQVKGLGLGLYYAWQVIKAHQGELGVTSTLTEGTTFTITLPKR
ncbi:sensor histidine kinase [Aquimarina brevivitae]|nr:HAMP domain-containing sensor histidine kinase [Aquimarina brevivitae]